MVWSRSGVTDKICDGKIHTSLDDHAWDVLVGSGHQNHSIVPLGCCKEPGTTVDALEPEVLAGQAPPEPEREEWPGTERWTGDFDGVCSNGG